ncbi:hypothetical protein H5P28_14185 [Ruficoccus amylovorans]|uniref:Uncharacterized protein n=1 Tax=Ruficoccus amylovorans TaxID=1804625 RepID=A0A842HG73_9BACT|nr:hypothetical protein [Ruficoccus amylovorans]MBC2595412.1 hypothetical protein [Ruficoccus amylovorans]
MSDFQDAKIPIYLDPKDRTLIDSTSEAPVPDEWYPMNGAADRLLKCQEALKDVEQILETYVAAKAKDKRRRRLRAMFVPLHSLCVNIVEVIDQIQTDKTIHSQIPSDTPATLTRLKSLLVNSVPFDRKGKLGMLRNRVSAHYERKMSPTEMRSLLNSTNTTEIGEWLHKAIAILCDLLKLDAYMWRADGPTDDTVIMMCQEPVISVLGVKDGSIQSLKGAYLRKISPRNFIINDIISVTESSQCLFECHSNYRIEKFVEDGEFHWAKSLSLFGSRPE